MLVYQRFHPHLRSAHLKYRGVLGGQKWLCTTLEALPLTKYYKDAMRHNVCIGQMGSEVQEPILFVFTLC